MPERPARPREYRCACGHVLGVVSNPHGGYARLWPRLAALDHITVEGHEVRLVCARCQAVRVWVLAAQQAA